MAKTATKMLPWIILYFTYSTVITVFASDTEAETLVPNAEEETTIQNTQIVTFSPNHTLSDEENDFVSILKTKHESLSSCALITMEPGEFELLKNGSVYIDLYELIFSESHYVLRNGFLFICNPIKDRGIEPQKYIYYTSYLTPIGLGISMVCLLIHLIIFTVVPDLKNLPGFNLAALCASLFFGYLFICLASLDHTEQNTDFCLSIAFLTHFFLLASVLWMSIMSYDVFMSLLRATGSLRTTSTNFTFKKFGLYCLYSFGIALLFAILSLLVEFLEDVPDQFKPGYGKLCWFSKKTPLIIFFGGPVIGLTCLNFIFFGLSAYKLHFNKMKQADDEENSNLKRRFFMYFRLSVIMGTSWIVGTAAAAFKIDLLWYIFVILNTLQGFFIFIAFTCSAKVKKYFRAKWFGKRRGSEQTLAPTFQSYCFYANSIEKDMDKVVENGKEKTDTIMIHL